MTEGQQENQPGSTSVDTGTTFKIELDPVNSVFGISADTLRLLAASYNVTPEALITRAVTMWAKAVIPDLDLDSPSLTPAQIELLAQRQHTADAHANQPQQTLADAFKSFSRVQETNMKMQNLTLAMGDILRAWTPFDGHPNVAGPKFRPVIFLGETVVNGATHWVVAYGTTRMQAGKESKSGSDFILRCTNDSSMVMNSDTRFDFSRLSLSQQRPSSSRRTKAAPLPGSRRSLSKTCHKLPPVWLLQK